MNAALYYSLIIIACITLHALYLQQKKNSYAINVVYPFLATLCFGLVFFNIEEIKGDPAEKKPPGAFTLVHYEMAGSEVIAWVRIEGKHKLFKFEASGQQRQALEEAKAKEENEGKLFEITLQPNEKVKMELVRLDLELPKGQKE